MDDLRLHAGAEDDVGCTVSADDGNHGVSIIGVADLANDVVHFVADGFFLLHVHRSFQSLVQFVVDVILNRLQQVVHTGPQHGGIDEASGAASKGALAIPVIKFLNANFSPQDVGEALGEPLGSDQMGVTGNLQIDVGESGFNIRLAVDLQIILIHEHGVSSFKSSSVCNLLLIFVLRKCYNLFRIAVPFEVIWIISRITISHLHLS